MLKYNITVVSGISAEPKVRPACSTYTLQENDAYFERYES